jgi:hypothetical protein
VENEMGGEYRNHNYFDKSYMETKSSEDPKYTTTSQTEIHALKPSNYRTGHYVLNSYFRHLGKRSSPTYDCAYDKGIGGALFAEMSEI